MNVIVAFPKLENANNIKSILNRTGFHVSSCCITGAQILQAAEELQSGVLVCSAKFPDMMFDEIREYLPETFEMLLIASPTMTESAEGQIICLNMPLKVHELVQTMEMMGERLQERKRRLKKKPKIRSKDDEALILRAKGVLMERNQMSEEEAHRYMQRRSMENGVNLVETAQMILSLMDR